MTPTVSLPWLAELREQARERFEKLGYPTTHDEDWRFTSVAPIARTHWGRPAEKWGVEVQPVREFGRWITFVNGRHAPHLSSELPDGVDLLDPADPEVEQHLGRYAPFQTHPFVALNTANLDEGVFLRVAEGAVIEEPIELVHVSKDIDGAATHPRNLILVGAHSQVTFAESFAGSSGRYFTNTVTEIVAGAGAVVDHYKLQLESQEAFHVGNMHVTLGRDVNFTSHSISLGAALSRNDITAVLSEGTECTLNGFYLVSGAQHWDTHTAIDHAKPHGTSHELYKGILGGKSNAVFNGKILVRKDAQKTDAKQTNKNLVLSEDATINTKPELQIFADDVRCTHGATIGQIDPESLFYLQARGIGQEEARSMLIVAFARDILDRIKIASLREAVEQLVGERLTRGL
jgi:Fe-S cluster assembly protein SufD